MHTHNDWMDDMEEILAQLDIAEQPPFPPQPTHPQIFLGINTAIGVKDGGLRERLIKVDDSIIMEPVTKASMDAMQKILRDVMELV